MNKTILSVALATSLASSAFAQTGNNPLQDMTVSGAVNFESEYVFRGKKITQEAFQPKVELGYPVYGGSLFAGIWTSQPISPSRPAAGLPAAPGFESNEIDLYGGYNYPLTQFVEGLVVGIGYTYYWYPDANGAAAVNHSSEINFGVTYDTSKVLSGINLNPSIYYFYDFNLSQNTLELSLSYTWDLSSLSGVSGISLVPKIYGGWNVAQRYGGDGSALQPLPQGAGGAWKNSYAYYGFNLDFNYKVNTFATLWVGFRVAGNTDGTGPNGIAGTNLGPRSEIWGGGGVKFGL